nr:hypothetical protein Iba_chr08aCG12610 [Ipomoea batatas]
MEISPLQPFEQMKSRCGHIVGPSSQHYPAGCSQTGIGRQSSRQSEQCRMWRHSRQHDSRGMMRKPEGIRSASSGNISSIGAKTSSEHAPTAFSSIPLHIWKGILPVIYLYFDKDIASFRSLKKKCISNSMVRKEHLQKVNVPRQKGVFVVESMSFKSNDFEHLRSRQKGIWTQSTAVPVAFERNSAKVSSAIERSLQKAESQLETAIGISQKNKQTITCPLPIVAGACNKPLAGENTSGGKANDELPTTLDSTQLLETCPEPLNTLSKFQAFTPLRLGCAQPSKNSHPRYTYKPLPHSRKLRHHTNKCIEAKQAK